MKVDVQPTVEVIEKMVSYIRDEADRIQRISVSMQRTGDISYAAEVVNEVQNMFMNLRLDLLVTRPIRAYQGEIDKLLEGE